MASWSVAILANPPVGGKYEVHVGDIIGYKPINKKNTWTTIEHKDYFIAQINGLSEDEMSGLCTNDDSNGNKRRFVLREEDMSNHGIDTAKLKNPDIVYKVPIIFSRNDFFDKQQNRHIANDDDITEK